jgi:poly-gamma-glutamate capsule biosynthesis protein CapA/YwtB (metallophosphatase superfamily)
MDRQSSLLLMDSITVVATGDLVIHGQLQQPAGQGTVYDKLRSADTSFANLEIPFVKEGYPAEKLIALKCDPGHAEVLRQIGVDVVTVANNHAVDYGYEGLRMTSQTLDTIGIKHVGIGPNLAKAFEPSIKVIKGVRIAYIGVATTLPNGSGAGPSRPGVAGVRVFSKYVVDTVTIDESPGMAPFVETTTYKPDEEVLLGSIRRAKGEADVVLVAIHWGVPYGWVASTQEELATYQRPLAHAMINAGASAIFGHHPHVVQGVEIYQGAPIFYSLGNFIFSNSIVTPGDEWRTYPPYSWESLQQSFSNIGALAKVSWKDGKVEGCSMIPLTITASGEPVKASSGDIDILLGRLRALSDGYETMFRLEHEGEVCEITIS